MRSGLLRIENMRFLLAVLLAASAARAETVGELVRSVRDALAAQRSDSEIATIVEQTRLTERLEDSVIEQLQSEGAGPRAVERLEWLREDSTLLPKAPTVALFDAPPPPPSEEQTRLIEKARAIALAYTAALPDFLCTETVRRYVRPKGVPWQVKDSFTMAVSYTGKGEAYQLLTIDGRPTNRSLEDVGGFQSEGEFGSQLRHIFRPESQARFTWQRWTNLRGRRLAVFSFRIEAKNSEYTLNNGRRRLTLGVIGTVYLDTETAVAVRVTAGSDRISSDWPVRATHSLLDYEESEVAGRRYLLPHRVDLRVTLRDSQLRSLMEFTGYRKFSADTSVTFEKQ